MVSDVEHVLLATGSRPFRPESIPFDDPRVFDSDSINGLNYLPKSIAITGSGIIAVEYAKSKRRPLRPLASLHSPPPPLPAPRLAP